jgi:tryptophan-rich sensory protein
MAGIFVCTFRLLLVLVVEDMLNTFGSMFIFLEDMLYYNNKQKPQILHNSKSLSNTLK